MIQKHITTTVEAGRRKPKIKFKGMLTVEIIKFSVSFFFQERKVASA